MPAPAALPRVRPILNPAGLIPGGGGGGSRDGTFLELLVGGQRIVVFQIGPQQPDIDLDGDGLERIETACSRKREVAQAVMEDAGIEKILEPDFTVSLRVSPPAVAVVNEAEIPEPYWIPQPPKLDRKGVLDALKCGPMVPGATFANSKVSLAIRTK
jgi:hypothetical protein